MNVRYAMAIFSTRIRRMLQPYLWNPYLHFRRKNNGLANICPKGQNSVAKHHEGLLPIPMNTLPP